MKRKLHLLIIIIGLTSISGFSQAKFALGVKGGINLSSIDAKASAGETYQSSTGFHGGLFATIKFLKIGVQPEVMFSRQGYITDTGASKDETKFDYVNIPIMIKWYMAKVVNIQVGPQFGMLTSTAFDAVGSSKSDFKGNDISLCMGIGLELPFKLNIDARYVLGLSDINNVAGATNALKNRTIQFSLGYRFVDKGN